MSLENDNVIVLQSGNVIPAKNLTYYSSNN